MTYSDADGTFPVSLNAAIHSPCHDVSSQLSSAEVIRRVRAL